MVNYCHSEKNREEAVKMGYKIIIADTNEDYRKMLTDTVNAMEGCAAVGATGDGAEALELAAKQQPYMVITDLILTGLDGI